MVEDDVLLEMVVIVVNEFVECYELVVGFVGVVCFFVEDGMCWIVDCKCLVVFKWCLYDVEFVFVVECIRSEYWILVVFVVFLWMFFIF